MFFVLSIFSYKFIRLRLFFIPFFLILIVFRFLSDLSDNTVGSQVYLFQNNFLIVHIISSLLSYSMLTISAITSISVFVKEKALKKAFQKHMKSKCHNILLKETSPKILFIKSDKDFERPLIEAKRLTLGGALNQVGSTDPIATLKADHEF